MVRRITVLTAVFFSALTLFVGVANAIAGAAALSLHTLLAIAFVSVVIAILRALIAKKETPALDWTAIVWVVIGAALTFVTAILMAWLTFHTMLAYVLLGIFTALVLVGEYLCS